jgi:hypothetical protein
MKKLSPFAAAGFMLFAWTGVAQAQASGSPVSQFPYAAPHEVQIINGVPCRTVLDQGTGQRVPVQCATSAGMIGMDPTATGSILASPPAGPRASGTPGSPFPYAARHEIRTINGVQCRTVLVEGTDQRVPVECAR